jgi:hypothetical protein
MAVDLGALYGYETKEGVRYILSGWREGGSPRGFYLSRECLHEKIDELLASLDARSRVQANGPRAGLKQVVG